jgi:hypothetical protein
MTGSETSRTHGRVLAATVLAALLLPGTPASAQAPPLDPLERQTLASLSSLLLSCNAYQMDEGHYPLMTDGFVEAELLRPHLSPVYVRELPVLDAWGTSFRYASDGKRMAFLSYGADRAPDRDYPALGTLQPAEGHGDDLVWSGGHLVVCPAHVCQLERQGAQKRTLADIRSLATAIESFRIDHGRVPGPTEGYVAVAMMREAIEPSYIRRAPLADGWGNTLVYRSDGQHYRLASPGRDGEPDGPYDAVLPGTTTQSFDSDIVLGDGQFLKQPGGEQR